MDEVKPFQKTGHPLRLPITESVNAQQAVGNIVVTNQARSGVGLKLRLEHFAGHGPNMRNVQLSGGGTLDGRRLEEGGCFQNIGGYRNGRLDKLLLGGWFGGSFS
jgi:hypothetical protein